MSKQKNNRIDVGLNNDDYRLIKDISKSMGMTMAGFIRFSALDTAIKYKNNAESRKAVGNV